MKKHFWEWNQCFRGHPVEFCVYVWPVCAWGYTCHRICCYHQCRHFLFFYFLLL